MPEIASSLALSLLKNRSTEIALGRPKPAKWRDFIRIVAIPFLGCSDGTRAAAATARLSTGVTSEPSWKGGDERGTTSEAGPDPRATGRVYRARSSRGAGSEPSARDDRAGRPAATPDAAPRADLGARGPTAAVEERGERGGNAALAPLDSEPSGTGRRHQRRLGRELAQHPLQDHE